MVVQVHSDSRSRSLGMLICQMMSSMPVRCARTSREHLVHVGVESQAWLVLPVLPARIEQIMTAHQLHLSSFVFFFFVFAPDIHIDFISMSKHESILRSRP